MTASGRRILQAQALGQRIGVALTTGSGISERAHVLTARGLSSAALASKLAAQPDVEFAVVDERRHLVAVPNDPFYLSRPRDRDAGRARCRPVVPEAPGARAHRGRHRAGGDQRRAGLGHHAPAARRSSSRCSIPACASTTPTCRAATSCPATTWSLRQRRLVRDRQRRQRPRRRPLRSRRLGDAGRDQYRGERSADRLRSLGQLLARHPDARPDRRGDRQRHRHRRVGRNVRVLPVRVLGKCGGYDADILAGMRWAAGIYRAGVPARPAGQPDAGQGYQHEPGQRRRLQRRVPDAMTGSSPPAGWSSPRPATAPAAVSSRPTAPASSASPACATSAPRSAFPTSARDRDQRPGGNCVNFGAQPACTRS